MEKEELDKKGTNTEYLPIKCRITRPAPPKPATNPLQFVKVGPCPLYKKAKEQIKKVEEVKVVRQEIREEAEDWQHNLDSWKSSRRKRQEHIIERVEEVKKIEQEVQDRGRKRTTFNEILEKRNRGRTKITIPIYDDDSNDLSDYGIGAGNTKLENEKVESLDNSNSVNQGNTNENITISSTNSTEIKDFPKQETIEPEIYKKETSKSYSNYVNNEPSDIEQYTYEGAIQNYRSRIKNKININESMFNKTTETTAATKDYSEVQSLLPKGNLYKRKEIFESEKTTIEIQPYESKVSQKLSDDFANTQTLKQRLESLEKCTEQLIKNADKNEIPVNTISSRLQKFNQITEPTKPAAPKKVPLFVPEKSNNMKHDWGSSKSDYERYSSAEEDIFMDKLNMFNRDLDTLYPKSVSDNCLHDSITSPYPPSSSSTDVVLSSDKEDSGIHTADVSCSVSQSDEALEDIDMSTNTIPRCIEKLNQENDAKEDTETKIIEKRLQHTKIIVESFLKNETDYSSECHQYLLDTKMQHSPLVEHIEETIKEKEIESATTDIIMENALNDDIFINLPMGNLQPPTQKPPPPPPVDEEPSKQIKKELLIKRSSFLGLPESPTNQIDPNELIEAPPDVNTFLQKEQSLYKNLHESKLYSYDVPKELERNNGVVLEEDEITKKEREIIELVEKEEKSKDFDNKTPTDYVNPINDYIKSSPYNDLGSKKFDSPYFVDTHFDNLDEQDSEVLKVEHELLQLEREELERQRENMLFHEKNKKIKQNQNSYDNLCGVNYYSDLSYCKSMPDLQQAPVECTNKSMYTHYSPICDNMQYCKSMPDIQHDFNRPMSEYYMQGAPAIGRRHSNQESAFKILIPEKNPKHLEIDKRALNMRLHQTELDNSYPFNKQPKYMNRQSFPTTASSKLRHSDNWKQPKANPEVKSYDQHWLFQEAELRRLSEQNLMSRGLPDKDMCDPTKLYKQRLPPKGYGDQKPPMRLPEVYSPKNRPRPYLGHSQTGHALPMSYQSPSRLDDSQEVILSVSGKKKCSYCGNELGRGAAMIIETLGLFYHMECFKCCVCHVELGDGLMGTDVRVRNQKLHCHNCYSSDDGVKFSCV